VSENVEVELRWYQDSMAWLGLTIGPAIWLAMVMFLSMQIAWVSLACGGINHGQVIGATDRLGGEASDRPVTFDEVHATLYHALGIDPNSTTVKDLNGRPHYLVENNTQPLHEVI
jgi:hypothetical protein